MAAHHPDTPGAQGVPMDSVEIADLVVRRLSDAIVGVDLDQRIRLWNDTAVEMFGYERDDIVGQPLGLIIPADARSAHWAHVNSFIYSSSERPAMSPAIRAWGLRLSGEEFPAEIGIARVSIDGGVMLVASVRDMTTSAAIEDDLQRRNSELDSILGALPDDVFRVTASGQVLDFLPGTGSAVDGAGSVGRNLAELLGTETGAYVFDKVRQVIDSGTVARFEYSGQQAGIDNDRHFESRLSRLSPTEVIMIVRDITDTRRAEAQLRYSATHDPLTGLVNRAGLSDGIERALRRSARHGTNLMVMMLDLDHFKQVNDSLGHDAGDRILKAVADRLKTITRAEDTVARLGGDEFVVVAEGFAASTEAVAFAHRVAACLRRRIELDTRDIQANSSIGVSTAADGQSTAATMLQQADAALYRAKAAGRGGMQVFDPRLAAEIDRFTKIESALRHSLVHGHLEVRFHPVYETASERITGAEITAACSAPRLGRIPTAELMGVSERSGLLVRIGAKLVEAACAQNNIWAFASGLDLTTAVKIRTRQLVEPGFVEAVRAALHMTGSQPSKLMLELDESSLTSPQTPIGTLGELDDLGVSLCLREFTARDSSLQRLGDLPLSYLKISEQLTRNLVRSTPHRVVAEANIAVAHTLGCKVIAEGVTEPEQVQILTDLGCHKVQGPLIGQDQDPESIARRAANRCF